MEVPHKASATRGCASRSSPLTSPDAVDSKCQKSPITCGLRRIPKPSLKILSEQSSPLSFAAQPSVSHTPAAAKKRTRRSNDSSTKLDKDGESVNPKKRCRNGISLPEISDFPMVDNWNCSGDLTVGSEGRVNNTNPTEQSCLSLAQPQGDSLPVQALEAVKCRERSKKQTRRKCNGRTIHSAAPAMNQEIESIVPENVDSEPVKESLSARASRENITNDAPGNSRRSVSKMSRLRDPRRRAGMIASPADRFSRVPISSGSQEQHILHGKSHVAGVANNREPFTPSFMPTRQWVGVGRRQHRSRDGRTSIAFPVSASSNVQQGEGSDSSRHERNVSAKANGLEYAKGGSTGTPHLKLKLNGCTLTARLSEYGAKPGDGILSTEMTEDGVESNQRSSKKVQWSNSVLVAQKNTIFQHEKISDGKKREERSRKISRFAKSGDSLPRERSHDRDLKPVGAVEKNESNKGSECSPAGKLSGQMNPILQENSLFYDGACNDWNEPFETPNLASTSSCLTSFEDLWKEMESEKVTHKDRSCPNEQGKLINGHIPELQTKVNEESQPILITHSAIATPATPGCPVPREEDISTDKSCRELDTGTSRFGPLFKRVLSALIFEDGRTFEGDDEEIMSFLQSGGEDYDGGKCEDSLIQGLRESESHGNEGNPCDDDGIMNIPSGISNYELPKRSPRSVQNERGLLVEGGFASGESSTSGSAYSDESDQRMSVDQRLLLELQSIGIFPESLPDLIGDEHEAITRNIFEAQKQVADQLGSDEARPKLLTETVSKGTSMNYEDVEGFAEEEEAADPSHIPQSIQRNINDSRCSNPKVPKVAANLRTMPVHHASDVASSQGKEHALLTAGAPTTKNSEKNGAIISRTDSALPDDHNGISAEILVNNTSKGKAKGESNAATVWGKQTDKVLAASEAMTTNVNEKGETGSMNPVRMEESSGPTNDMFDGMELSYWLDTGTDDAPGEGDMFGLDIPMDDLSNVGLLL